MFNNKEVKTILTAENIFYTSIISFLYIFGIYSIIQNFKTLINNPDLDHFVYLLISVIIWGLLALVYIGKLRYFSEVKPKLDEKYLVKPNMDLDHMIWFFIQLYILVSFFLIFIEWHNTIQKTIKEVGIFNLVILFLACIPFLMDAYKVNMNYFIIGVSMLLITATLLLMGFFESGCYALNASGIREYLVDCN
jgi:hypothetical protein